MNQASIFATSSDYMFKNINFLFWSYYTLILPLEENGTEDRSIPSKLLDVYFWAYDN